MKYYSAYRLSRYGIQHTLYSAILRTTVPSAVCYGSYRLCRHSITPSEHLNSILTPSLSRKSMPRLIYSRHMEVVKEEHSVQRNLRRGRLTALYCTVHSHHSRGTAGRRLHSAKRSQEGRSRGSPPSARPTRPLPQRIRPLPHPHVRSHTYRQVV